MYTFKRYNKSEFYKLENKDYGDFLRNFTRASSQYRQRSGQQIRRPDSIRELLHDCNINIYSFDCPSCGCNDAIPVITSELELKYICTDHLVDTNAYKNYVSCVHKFAEGMTGVHIVHVSLMASHNSCMMHSSDSGPYNLGLKISNETNIIEHGISHITYPEPILSDGIEYKYLDYDTVLRQGMWYFFDGDEGELKFPMSVHHIDCNKFEEIPWERRYGIELESAEWVRMKRDSTVFGCKYDGTCGGGEYFSPILQGDTGYEHIKKLCTEHGLTADNSCGLHLHLDCRDLTSRQVLKVAQMFELLEPVLMHCVTGRRRNNSYSRQLHEMNTNYLGLQTGKELVYAVYSSPDPDRSHGHGKRYEWLNIHSFFHRKTIEIRLHHGSFDHEEIKDWINLCQAIFHLALKWPGIITEERRGLALLILCDLFPYAKEIILTRLSRYGKQSISLSRYRYTPNLGEAYEIENPFLRPSGITWYQAIKAYLENNLPKLQTKGTKQCAESLAGSGDGPRINLKFSPYLTKNVALTPGGFSTRITSTKILDQLAAPSE